jgi:hypothetical protein
MDYTRATAPQQAADQPTLAWTVKELDRIQLALSDLTTAIAELTTRVNAIEEELP